MVNDGWSSLLFEITTTSLYLKALTSINFPLGVAIWKKIYGQDAAIWSNLKAFTAIISTCRCSSSFACLGDFEAPNCPSGFVSLSIKRGWFLSNFHQTCQFYPVDYSRFSRSKIGILTLSVFLVQCSKMFKVYRFSIIFPFTLSFLGYILFTHKPLFFRTQKSPAELGRLLPDLGRMPEGVVLWKGASSVAEEESAKHLITDLRDWKIRTVFFVQMKNT